MTNPKTKTCQNCGETFTKRPRDTLVRFASIKYCSHKCAGAGRRAKPTPKVCENCGESFRRRRDARNRVVERLSRYQKRVYCDAPVCLSLQNPMNDPLKAQTKTCVACGSDFARKRHRNGALSSSSQWKKRTHCYDCRDRAGHTNVGEEGKTCVYCGDKFGRKRYDDGKPENKKHFRARKNCLKDSCAKQARSDRCIRAAAKRHGNTKRPGDDRRTCVRCGDEFGRRFYESGRHESLKDFSRRKYCDKGDCVSEMRRVRGASGNSAKRTTSRKPYKPRKPKPKPKPRPKAEATPKPAPATREAPAEQAKLPTPWGITHRHTTWETTPATYVAKNGMCERHPDEPISVYGKCAKCELKKRGVSQIRRPGLS